MTDLGVQTRKGSGGLDRKKGKDEELRPRGSESDVGKCFRSNASALEPSNVRENELTSLHTAGPEPPSSGQGRTEI